MSLATDIISVSVASGALVVAALGLRRSGRANELAEQALNWQRQRDEHRSRTQVRVEFGHRLTRFPSPAEGILLDTGALPLDYVLTLEVVNEHAERTEYVTSAWIEFEGLSRGIDLLDDTAPSRGDPELKPRGRIVFPLVLYGESEDFAAGFCGVIRLADGEFVRSDVEHLHDELVHDMLRHNSRGRRDAAPDADADAGS